MLEHDFLLKVLDYDELSGVFRWRRYPGRYNRAGKIAGSNTSEGYRIIRICGKCYYAHRLVWFYKMGRWPKHEIDHRNRKRSDNRFRNLREATDKLQASNRKGRKITDEQVWSIRGDERTHKEIAREHRISQSTVSRTKSGERNWTR